MEGPVPDKYQINELGRMFHRLHGLASAQVFQHMSQAMHSIDLSFSQINALFRLYRYGPQSIAALARGAHLSHAATSRMVDRLVRTGLVDRRPNPENRRQKDVRPTQKGRDCLDDLQAYTASTYTELFKKVPEPLLGELRACLAQILPYLPARPLADAPVPGDHAT